MYADISFLRDVRGTFIYDPVWIHTGQRRRDGVVTCYWKFLKVFERDTSNFKTLKVSESTVMPLLSHPEYVPRALLTMEKIYGIDRQTDARPMHYAYRWTRPA